MALSKIKLMRKYNTGLVLSGGAARGFFHLGVLKALEENNIKPDIISAVSAGSIAGAFYADGYTPDEILGIYKGMNIFEIMQITVPKTGFFSAKGLKFTLEKYLRAKTFEELKIPLIVAVTNILKGKVEYLQKGKLVDAILASSAVPVLFDPVKIGEDIYIDGGVIDNMPVEPIKRKCKKLIGVYIIPTGEIKKINGIAHIAERAFYLSMASKIMDKESAFDIYIAPEDITKYGFFDIQSPKPPLPMLLPGGIFCKRHSGSLFYMTRQVVS